MARLYLKNICIFYSGLCKQIHLNATPAIYTHKCFGLTLNADGLLTPTELNRPTVEVYGHRMYQY